MSSTEEAVIIALKRTVFIKSVSRLKDYIKISKFTSLNKSTPDIKFRCHEVVCN